MVDKCLGELLNMRLLICSIVILLLHTPIAYTLFLSFPLLCFLALLFDYLFLFLFFPQNSLKKLSPVSFLFSGGPLNQSEIKRAPILRFPSRA